MAGCGSDRAQGLPAAAVQAAVRAGATSATAAAVAASVAEAALRTDAAQAALLGVAFRKGIDAGWSRALLEQWQALQAGSAAACMPAPGRRQDDRQQEDGANEAGGLDENTEEQYGAEHDECEGWWEVKSNGTRRTLAGRWEQAAAARLQRWWRVKLAKDKGVARPSGMQALAVEPGAGTSDAEESDAVVKAADSGDQVGSVDAAAGQSEWQGRPK
ncbi:unnamed protein product [Prorocentrum cordatum]|uniref:Uncharacterized protein n=1 Tax=Prorocentrum cordatum TaxID=2364126 RepID=A0ABN9TN74_9DINO|nr:unnamed protein product [Polarella glacialis]